MGRLLLTALIVKHQGCIIKLSFISQQLPRFEMLLFSWPTVAESDADIVQHAK